MIARLASVLSRRSDLLSDTAEEAGLGVDEAVMALILYLVKRFGLKYKRARGFERFLLLGAAYKLVANAVKFASRLRLRTLDLLHVAYAVHLREVGGPT
jgi:predicted nucleic acid-binding protein